MLGCREAQNLSEGGQLMIDPAMELKDKTHHNKMDVDLKNVYSGKHDFIRDREKEGKREHTEHSGSENQDYFLLTQT